MKNWKSGHLLKPFREKATLKEKHSDFVSKNIDNIGNQKFSNIQSVLPSSGAVIDFSPEIKGMEVVKSSKSYNKEETQKCKGCHGLFQPNFYIRHIKSCKVYSKFIKEVSTGFQCQVCLKIDVNKWTMFNHFTTVHSEIHKATILAKSLLHKEQEN